MLNSKEVQNKTHEIDKTIDIYKDLRIYRIGYTTNYSEIC